MSRTAGIPRSLGCWFAFLADAKGLAAIELALILPIALMLMSLVVFGGQPDVEVGAQRASHLVGKELAERAKKAGVGKVVFDRGAYMYHGRVKALAEGAREGGLDF